MCTVIVEVPEEPDAGVRLIAVRDEQPERAWDAPGKWWDGAHAATVGVRDRQAGGAWLATAGDRLSVILNRAESVAALLPAGSAPLGSRGGIVLDSIAGKKLSADPHTESFNLVEISGSGVSVNQWSGQEVRTQTLRPGVHMIAHGDVDDQESARIKEWAPKFKALAGLPEAKWQQAWLEVLQASTALHPGDDRAIIRDNTVHGYPTKSLLICTAVIHPQKDVDLESATLAEPARWHGEAFTRAV